MKIKTKVVLIFIIAGIEFINVQMLIKSQTEEIKGVQND